MLDLSNDYLEGQWIHRVVESAFAERETTSKHSVRLMQLVEKVTAIPRIAGFCLSEEGDQLSQWRGYANNGTGFSIGFNEEHLEKLGSKYRDEKDFGFSVQKVLYHASEQRAALQQILDLVEEPIQAGALTTPTIFETEEDASNRRKKSGSLWFALGLLMFDCYRMKNPAFHEEKEWRVMAFSFLDKEKGSSVPLENIDYRASETRVTPFIPVDLDAVSEKSIEEVILGPRNQSRLEDVELVLRRCGFTNVSVRKSAASYR